MSLNEACRLVERAQFRLLVRQGVFRLDEGFLREVGDQLVAPGAEALRRRVGCRHFDPRVGRRLFVAAASPAAAANVAAAVAAAAAAPAAADRHEVPLEGRGAAFARRPRCLRLCQLQRAEKGYLCLLPRRGARRNRHRRAARPGRRHRKVANEFGASHGAVVRLLAEHGLIVAHRLRRRLRQELEPPKVLEQRRDRRRLIACGLPLDALGDEPQQCGCARQSNGEVWEQPRPLARNGRDGELTLGGKNARRRWRGEERARRAVFACRPRRLLGLERLLRLSNALGVW